MMPGAAFTFDVATEAALRAVWQTVADAGLSDFMLKLDYPPHLTLFGCEVMDRPGLRAAFQALGAAQPPLEVNFASLGLFPGDEGVVFLAPIVNAALLDLHARFWTAAMPHVQGARSYYRPDVWAPHVTLAFAIPAARLGAVTEVLAHASLPTSGKIAGVLLGEFNPYGPSALESIPFSAQER